MPRRRKYRVAGCPNCKRQWRLDDLDLDVEEYVIPKHSDTRGDLSQLCRGTGQWVYILEPHVAIVQK